MPRYHPELAKLIIYNSQKSKSFVSSFITQPKLEEERLGQIFIVAEIKQKNIAPIATKEYQKFIDVLIGSIRNNYYNKNRGGSEFGKDSVELLFEAAIQKTNRDLQTYLLQRDRKAAENFLENANIALGVSFQHQAHFAVVGGIEIFLVRKNKISNVLTAGGGGQAQRAKTNPAKIFSHLISGNLETDDGLIFCTPSLLDYFSVEKIKRIIKENAANKIIQTFNALLTQIDEKAAMAGVIIKLAAGLGQNEERRTLIHDYFEPIKKRPMFKKPEKNSAQESIAELLNRQEETNRIMTSPASEMFKKMLGLKFLKKKDKNQDSPLGEAIQTYKVSRKTKTLHFPETRKIPAKAKREWFSFWRRLRRPTGAGSETKILGKKNYGKKKISWISAMILIIAILFGILFIQSLFSLDNKMVIERRKITIKEVIDKMKERNDLADSRLILGDQSSAMEMYENILTEIDKLPAKTADEQKDIEVLKNKVSEKINEINKIKVPNLSELIDLEKFSYFSATAPIDMLRTEESIYLASDSGAFYVYDLTTGEIEEKNKFDLGAIKSLKISGNNRILAQAADFFVELDLGAGRSDKIALEARPDLEITDFQIYNGKLYILDAGKNAILKYSRLSNKFTGETLWLKDDTDIRQGAAIAIDSPVWVITTEGKLIKLMRGAKEELTSEVILPKLTRPEKLWTEKTLDNLYFMDAPSKRLIIISKEGKLIAQYKMEKINDLRGFAVDEKNGKFYLLTGMKIFEGKME